jgi:hypothetical protein
LDSCKYEGATKIERTLLQLAKDRARIIDIYHNRWEELMETASPELLEKLKAIEEKYPLILGK